MSRYMLLVCKRLLILVLISGLAWLTFFKVYPFIDARTPVWLAIIATYAFIAYIGLPFMIRVWHLLHKPTHVPTRTIAGDGWAVDPINIVLIARNERDIKWAMRKAGWLLADEKNILTSLRTAYAIIFNKPYPHAPFGNYYVFGRKQTLGFQIPVGNSPRNRHHVRFWRLGPTILEDDHEHHGFWRSLLKKFMIDERQVWIGAAVEDRGVNIRWRNLQIDHGIISDTGQERDFLVQSLQNAGVISDCIDIKAGEPLHTRHQGLGEKIIADGYVKLCEVKRQILPPHNTQ